MLFQTRSTSSNRVLQWLGFALLGLAVAAAWGATIRGVDYSNYQAWTGPVLTADVSTLGNQQWISPYGLPFFHWSPGPALLAAPATWAVYKTAFRSYAELGVGFVCVLAFWRFFYDGLRELAGRSAARWGCLLAMVATSLGSYSLNISSEAMMLAPAGALFLECARWAKGKTVRSWLVVAATCLLAMLRPQYAIYALPALTVWGLSEWVELRSSPMRTIVRLAACGLAFALVLWQIGTMNRWMTGNFWQSPYYFGDEGFRSFDPNCPHLAEVLFDPFHGFLPTTPLVALGFVALIAVLFAPHRNQKSVRTKFVLIAGAVAVASNAYTQGCWYYWWLASGFGMRGMVLSNIYIIAALVVGLRGLSAMARRSAVAKKVEWLVAALAAACALWSWVLARGEMRNVEPTDWTSTLNVFAKEGTHWMQVERWSAIVGGIVLGTLTWSTWGRRKGPKALIVLVSACLVWIHLVEQAVHVPGEPLIAWGLFAVVAIAAAFNLDRRLDVWPKVLALATIATWIAFVPMAWRAESMRKPVPEQPVTFNAVDVRLGYQKASDIPRMREQAQHIRAFLVRQKGEEWANVSDGDRD